MTTTLSSSLQGLSETTLSIAREKLEEKISKMSNTFHAQHDKMDGYWKAKFMMVAKHRQSVDDSKAKVIEMADEHRQSNGESKEVPQMANDEHRQSIDEFKEKVTQLANEHRRSTEDKPKV